jgi:hypothetical protein
LKLTKSERKLLIETINMLIAVHRGNPMPYLPHPTFMPALRQLRRRLED